MKEINTAIRIASTPDKVWETLMKLENWSNWNPIVNNIGGELTVGGKLSITMSNLKGNDSKKYDATITALDKNQRFSFIAKMMTKFLFSAERIIELKLSDEETIFKQREVYTGIMVALFWKKLSTDALGLLNAMNEALKIEIEK